MIRVTKRSRVVSFGGKEICAVILYIHMQRRATPEMAVTWAKSMLDDVRSWTSTSQMLIFAVKGGREEAVSALSSTMVAHGTDRFRYVGCRTGRGGKAMILADRACAGRRLQIEPMEAEIVA